MKLEGDELLSLFLMVLTSIATAPLVAVVVMYAVITPTAYDILIIATYSLVPVVMIRAIIRQHNTASQTK